MPRPIPKEAVATEHDSFLDIVANIVGILIILVMVVGVRAKNAPIVVALPSESSRVSAAELEKERENERLLHNDVLQLAEQTRSVHEETLRRDQLRDNMAVRVAAWERENESRRGNLDARSQAEFDLKNGLASAQASLNELLQERERTLQTESKPVLVESYPTPLSKTVHGREAHFQLRDGRIAYVPWDELLNRFVADARQKAHKLHHTPELTETVGPVGGFRLRYTLVRRELSLDLQMASGRSGSYPVLLVAKMIPVTSQLGETFDEALSEGSEFRRILSRHRPGRTTITLWTYPDSFDLYRGLKKELYRMEFPTAARPLPWGVPISGSPEGTKSAAE